ncbi:glycosyltransferase family 39 protein [Tenacibaculum ovolyticum]|uniref:glycosyltransferase family 39 protein n=1 Tax=Tenacibaculum ovolyticum TaxID=104270 RepID=UPI001F1F86E3|nr:glycosyltransferase family 39 protein [Tenacibaculum ovolyticum]
MIFFLKKYEDQLWLLALWVLIILIINPLGDFPLNDDWCYGKSVKTLYENGYLKIYNWGEMTLVGHVYWGYFFTKIFGFSFTVLRFSTLIMGFATILGVYELFKLSKLPRWMALFSTLLCVMNPIFLSLSFSFMTDIPFCCLTIWGFYFFSKAIIDDTDKSLYWAIFFCCWAFLIRQLAWVFPVVWLITVLYLKKKDKKNLIRALTPLLVLIIFSFFFSYIMEVNEILQERYNSKFKLLIEKIISLDKIIFLTIFGYLLKSLTYLGFLLAPIHLFYFKRFTFKGYKISAIMYTLIVTALLLVTGNAIPSLDNIWIDFGIGPTLLSDYYGDVKSTPYIKAPSLFWQIVTTIGVFSSVTLVLHAKKMVTSIFLKKNISPLVVLSFVFFIVYLSPFLVVGLYDRYLLPLFPIIIVFLGANYKQKPTRIFKSISLTFLGLLSIFSVLATHDYLSWNRVRWKIVDELVAKEVPKNHIHGGGEYTAWYFFSGKDEKWWENIKPVYSLVFHVKPNESVFKEYSYSRWFPGKPVIYLIYNEDLDKKLQ